MVRGLRLASWVLATCLVACGEGSGPADRAAPASGQQQLKAALAAAMQRPTAPAAAPAAAPAQALAATTTGVDEVDAAEQLLDFAERSFPELFPGHPATALYDGYRYRFHAQTGIYLGVRDGQVYVMGGRFGTAPVAVGPLAQFITPTASARTALCAAPGPTRSVYATLAPVAGKNAAAAIAACSGRIDAPSWRQTGGPAVSLLSERSQAISFEAPQPGTYSFELQFKDAAGTAQRESVSIAVAEPAPAARLLTVRLSHAVRMGGKVSLRAWPAHDRLEPGETVKDIRWTQLDGPSVALDVSDPERVLFQAPDVPRDTLLRLRATLQTSTGRVDTDEVVVLVERHVQSAPDDIAAMWAGEHVPRVFPYRSDGPYAPVLQRCVFDTALAFGDRFNLCPMQQLPFLAVQTRGAVPSVEQVMDRVLVSHDWLGRNFEHFLRNHDPQGDFRRMLASVTAVVLSTQVRPSFYYAGTGAIYLDGDSFWLTPEERDTLNEAPDYREAFDDGLRYANLWRYVLDGRSLSAYYDPALRVARPSIELRNEAAPLLYHELAHALDFLPPADYLAEDLTPSAWEYVALRYVAQRMMSDNLQRRYPLRSVLMAGLGGVKYRGNTPSEAERSFTPEQVGSFFGSDLAVDEYAYASPREDLAMTLEEFLMARRLGIRRDIAFTAPYTKDDTSGTIIVRWGQRGRIGVPALADRTRAAVQQLLPWIELTDVDQLPPMTELRIGESWRANLGAPKAAALSAPTRREATAAQKALFARELRRMRHHLHVGARPLPPLPVHRHLPPRAP